MEERREKIRARIAIGAFVASLIFGGVALLLPPEGVISPSVLIFVGQLLLFCSMLLGFTTQENKLLKEVVEIVKEIKNEK